MFNNEGFFTLSAEATEDLGLDQLEDADDESPLAPVPGYQQTLSSSSDDEGEDTSDEDMEGSEEQNSDSELSREEDNDDDGVYLTGNIYESGHIGVNIANFTDFATKLKLDQFPVTVHISNEGKEVITYIGRQSKVNGKNCSFGLGYIGNPGLVIAFLGLTRGCVFKMKYNGCSMRPLPKSVRREKIYNLQIIDINAMKKNERKAATWAAEAANQPLVPAQLPHGVPTQWSTKVFNGHAYLRLPAEQHKIFKDQICEPHERRVDVLCDLEIESSAHYYTSFRGTEIAGDSNFRNGRKFCTLAGFAADDVIKMHYLGYRELSGGRKVYCLRAEKVSSAEKVRSAEKEKVSSGQKNEESLELSPRLAKKRAQEALAKQFSSDSDEAPAPSPKRQQGPSLNDQEDKVPRKIPQPRNKMEKPSQLTTPSPAPTSAAPPASAVRPQQVQRPQQMHQQPHGGAGPSPLRRQYVAASWQQQDQPGSSIVDLVVKALLHRTDVDRTLVGRYLSLFTRLPEITRALDGSVILRLAAEPSVEALQTFLESAVLKSGGGGGFSQRWGF